MRQTIRSTIPSVADQVGLKIIDIESGKERHLPGSFHGFKAWSPDGKYIACADADNNLCIVPVEGGPSADSGAWRHPPLVAAMVRRPRTSLLQEVGPGSQVMLHQYQRPESGADRVNGLSWEIRCLRSRELGGLRATDWGGHGGSVLRLLAVSLSFSLALEWVGFATVPSGRELFFASWWSYINTGPIVLDTKDKQLYRVLDYPVDQLLWSPDGSKMAIGAAREIWIMDLDPNVPISQVLGRKIPGNDVIRYQLDKLSNAIVATPAYPENYLERAPGLYVPR